MYLSPSGKFMKNLIRGGWIEWQEYETTVKTDDSSFPKDSNILK